ncbi:hypothetical protein MMC17_000282 [Xylographa soralifera]|nr:hypothetical protein [Xylographa soralifera]
MASDHVLRIPRSDIQGEYVIVNVSPNGPALLDLQLIGTEGTTPYLETVKESGVSKLLSKNSPVTVSQWEAILNAIFVQKRPISSTSKALANLEVVASLIGDQLSIVFRKNISGIQQRVGEIVLKQDDDQEIDTIAWLKSAICHADNLEGEITELSNKFREQSEVVKKLNLQIENMIETQQQYVSSSLERFMVLLNEKKLKIRDQQRLLATAKVDSKKGRLCILHSSCLLQFRLRVFMPLCDVKLSNTAAQAIRAGRYRSTGIPPETSRPNKRKQRIEYAASASGSEDDGFEDIAAEDPDSVTPEKSDLEVSSDDDDDPDTGTQNEMSKTGAGRKGKALERTSLATDVDEPPPRRQLPFGTISGKKTEERREVVSGQASSKGNWKEGVVEEEQSLDSDETSDDEL